MAIKCDNDLRDLFVKIGNIINREFTLELKYLGEEANNKARNRTAEESWIDQTGNLRSSIGYSVYKDGERKAQGGFNAILGAQVGSRVGKSYIKKLAQLYSSAFALIVVAGMEYAQYVEAMKGKDVLASVRMWAEAEIDRRLFEAQKRAERKINKLLK